MTSAFDNTPIVIAQKPTTFGELRGNAQIALNKDMVSPEYVRLAAIIDPKLTTGALRGMAQVILALLDEVERLSGMVQEPSDG